MIASSYLRCQLTVWIDSVRNARPKGLGVQQLICGRAKGVPQCKLGVRYLAFQKFRRNLLLGESRAKKAGFPTSFLDCRLRTFARYSPETN